MREIQLRDAKANLSAVVDQAVGGEPSVITRHGKREVVILSFEDWQRLSQVPSFGRLLMSAPEGARDLPKRSKSHMRATSL
jgi:prevent-host-death family protein